MFLAAGSLQRSEGLSAKHSIAYSMTGAVSTPVQSPAPDAPSAGGGATQASQQFVFCRHRDFPSHTALTQRRVTRLFLSRLFRRNHVVLLRTLLSVLCPESVFLSQLGPAGCGHWTQKQLRCCLPLQSAVTITDSDTNCVMDSGYSTLDTGPTHHINHH